MNNLVLKKKFIEGLKQYNLTYEEVNNNWKYCGGDHDQHLSYFHLVYPEKNNCQNIRKNAFAIMILNGIVI